MEFSKDGNKQDLLLEPCSLLVMKEEARYEWQHSIPARKSDKINGITIPRARRVSMTFRNMILK
jgi:alkylated DNA repair dioxygenase AlkB